jgi:hypothetical protein
MTSSLSKRPSLSRLPDNAKRSAGKKKTVASAAQSHRF